MNVGEFCRVYFFVGVFVGWLVFRSEFAGGCCDFPEVRFTGELDECDPHFEVFIGDFWVVVGD